MSGDGPGRALELSMFIRASADQVDAASTPTQSDSGLQDRSRLRRPWDHRRWLHGRARITAETALALVVLDLLASAQFLWPAQLAALAILLLLPGFLLLRATGLSTRGMAGSPGWLPVTSLVTLTIVGLATDVLGQALGLAQPLRTIPLLLATNLTCLLLALLPGQDTSPFDGLLQLIDGIELRSLATLAIPGLAIVGALRLDSTGGSTVAIAIAAAALASLAVAVWFAGSWSVRRLSWLLYSSTAALLLSFSLRSSYVFGWDISAEYGLVRATLLDGVWQTAHPGDAYGAMLSLTILPAVLHSITGLSGLVLLKLVYPALFGLFPVATFILLHRVLSKRAALLAASLLLAQGAFLREMPALARQELALLTYVSLLAVMLDRSMRRGPQVTLLAVLSFGVTVFHYSTNYTLISLLMLAIVVEFVASFWHRSRRYDPRKVLTLALALGLGLVWYAGITRSTSHAIETADSLMQSGFQILPDAQAGENPIQAFLKGNLGTAPTVPEYQTQIAKDYAEQRPWVVKAPDAADPRWRLAAPPSTGTGPVGSSRIGALANLVVLAANQLVNALAVLGTIILLLRRKISGPLLDFAVLALPAVMLLAVVRLSGTIAAFYGQGRLLIQLLPIVAVPVFWLVGPWYRSGVGILRTLGRRSKAQPDGLVGPALIAAITTVVLVQVANASGLLSAALGDRTSSNLYNSGENFERFYVTNPEVAAAQWLAQAQPSGTLTYTDLYGQLRIYGYGEVKGTLLTDITPETVDVNAWVYGSRANVVGGRARASAGSDVVVYVFPKAFLRSQLGVVYTNGTAEIYHR